MHAEGATGAVRVLANGDQRFTTVRRLDSGITKVGIRGRCSRCGGGGLGSVAGRKECCRLLMAEGGRCRGAGERWSEGGVGGIVARRAAELRQLGSR